MRIGVDASTWHNGRGFGRFTRELLGALARLHSPHRFVLLADAEGDMPAGVDTVVVPQSRRVTEAAVADGNRSPRDLLRFTAAARGARLDVLFYPAVYSWFPCPIGLPSLVTLHDAIPERFPDLVFPRRLARFLWNTKVRLARAQATRFLTVSHAAKREIVEFMGLDPARIDVTTEGAKSLFRPLADASAVAAARNAVIARHGLAPGARYFVYVGGFAPHKNVIALVQAFARLHERHPDAADVALVLVGDLGSHGFNSNMDDLRAAIAASPATARAVHFTGFAEDEWLRSVYAGAIALVFPSLSEGFGLPAVEAMACGTPVIASDAGSLPEVVGDAGVLFPPHDVDALTACMHRLATRPDERATLAARAVPRAARFSWQRGAELALASIERCCGPDARRAPAT